MSQMSRVEQLSRTIKDLMDSKQEYVHALAQLEELVSQELSIIDDGSIDHATYLHLVIVLNRCWQVYSYDMRRKVLPGGKVLS